jgi:uncharacterized protein (TIGR04540 family)
MEIKLFYKSQVEIADIINEIIDQYWDNEIDEPLLMENISKLYNNNQSKIIKNGQFTTIIKQKCGKRRIEVLYKILEIMGKSV